MPLSEEGFDLMHDGPIAKFEQLSGQSEHDQRRLVIPTNQQRPVARIVQRANRCENRRLASMMRRTGSRLVLFGQASVLVGDFHESRFDDVLDKIAIILAQFFIRPAHDDDDIAGRLIVGKCTV